MGDKRGKLEVLISGRLYDVTTFKHPGGNIFKFYERCDATQAWNEFHMRSERAKKLLDKLPSRPYSAVDSEIVPDSTPLSKGFQKLRDDLVREGFFKPSPVHTAYRISELVLMHLVGLYLVSINQILLGLVILGVAQGRCGWLMHEGGHYSLTANINIDQHIQMLFYGLGCGMSGGWWRNQHNKHHAMPQKLKHDVDLDTLPVLAFHKKVLPKRLSPLQAKWLALQSYLFPTVSNLIVALGWQFFLHPRHIQRKKIAAEAFWLVVRYILWAAYFGRRFGAMWAFIYYVMYVWVGANYIFLHFSMSHTHLPVLDATENVEWARYAASHTMNVEASWWCNWVMSYLNFQIEHHLFPSMPQFRHPKVSPRVKKLFEENGLKYDVRSYTQSFRDVFANLESVGHHAVEQTTKAA